MKRPEHDLLEDQAWAALRARLDEEMPEKPRRRLLAWWFLLLLLTGLLFSWIFTRPVRAPETPRAAAGSGSSAVGSGLSAVGSGLSVVGGRPAVIVGGLSAVGGWERGSGGAFDRESHQEQVEGEADLAAGNQHPDSDMTRLAVLPHVAPSVVCEYAPAVTAAADHQAVIRPHRDASRVWTPLLGVQTGWRNVPRPDEVGLLAGVEWQPRGASFGLRAGLAYRYANTEAVSPSLVRLVDQSRFPDYLESFQAPGSTNSLTPGGDVLEVPVTHRHIVEMPVQVFWQPRPAFRLYAGMAPGYVLGVQIGDTGRYNQEKLVRLDRNALLRKQVLEENSRWLAPGLFGAGFRWGRRWEATVMWRTSGSVHTGLQYRFGPR